MHNAAPQSTCPDAERQAEARLNAFIDAINLPLSKARGIVELLPYLDRGVSLETLMYIIGDYLDAMQAALDGEIEPRDRSPRSMEG